MDEIRTVINYKTKLLTLNENSTLSASAGASQTFFQ